MLDAHATFCARQPGPRHAISSSALTEDPESLPELTTIPDVPMRQLRTLGPLLSPCEAEHGFSRSRHRAAAFCRDRAITPQFWLRGRHLLAANSRAQQAVFAYLSDWCLNFGSVGGHLRDLHRRSRSIFQASITASGFTTPSRRWLDAFRNRKSFCRGRPRTVRRTCSRLHRNDDRDSDPGDSHGAFGGVLNSRSNW